MNMFDQLTATADLNDAGREAVEVAGGGGAKFATAVPSGFYLASFNRYGALGPITSMQSQGQGTKPEAKTTETIKVGFELLQLVVPNNPEDKDFEMVRVYKKDDVETKVPYIVDINGMFNLTRSSNDKAKFPKIVDRMRRALPYDIQDKVKENKQTLSEAFPTLKSMFGQQFIVYVQKAKRGDREFNEVLFTAKAAAAMTEFNKNEGHVKEVQELIELYPHDDKERSIGFAGCEKGLALNSKAILFDVDAKDTQQIHLDSVAHEFFYVGKDAIKNKPAVVEFCEILDANMKLGKYSGTEFEAKVKAGTVVIPEPTPRTEKKTEDENAPDTKFDDSSALEEVAAAPTAVEVKAEEKADAATATETYGL